MKSCGRYCLAILLGLAAAGLDAVDSIDLHFDSLQGAGWSARDVHISVQALSGLQPKFTLTAARVELPEGLAPITGLRVECAALVARDDEISCQRATVSLPTPIVDASELQGDFRYLPLTREIDWRISDLRLAGGHVQLIGRHHGDDWRLSLRSRGVDLDKLTALATGWSFWPAGFTAQGVLNGSAEWSGRAGADQQQLKLDANAQDLGYATADGSSAAEAVQWSLKVDASRASTDWDMRIETQAHAGTFCLADCWELLPTPLDLRGRILWSPTRITLEDFLIKQAGVADAALRAEFAGADRSLAAMSLRIDQADLSTLYPTYLQPLLIGGSLEALETTGAITGRIDYADDRWRYDIATEGADISDSKDRFALAGLQGRLRWGDQGAVTSELAFAAGHVYRLPVGAARLSLLSEGDAIRLTAPLELPLLDGALRVEQFTLAGPGTPNLQWSFSGLLKPVSMADFSRAMDWPEMGGKLSGLIPEVRFAEGSLNIGGVLLVRAFDGAITVRDLRIEDLFGVLPKLYTDISIDNLDLDELTRTFSFGNIQGRFSGHVHDMVLSRWRPVAFDAVLATPENDRSRHRISQKAVDNLTNIGGGGVGGALSRSFLGVFENFGYDRLGISCRLRNGVCYMDGVAPAGEGYYIVKGGGLPRIDVIGHAREVDWEVLLGRLQRVTAGNSAVVE